MIKHLIISLGYLAFCTSAIAGQLDSLIEKSRTGIFRDRLQAIVEIGNLHSLEGEKYLLALVLTRPAPSLETVRDAKGDDKFSLRMQNVALGMLASNHQTTLAVQTILKYLIESPSLYSILNWGRDAKKFGEHDRLFDLTQDCDFENSAFTALESVPAEAIVGFGLQDRFVEAIRKVLVGTNDHLRLAALKLILKVYPAGWFALLEETAATPTLVRGMAVETLQALVGGCGQQIRQKIATAADVKELVRTLWVLSEVLSNRPFEVPLDESTRLRFGGNKVILDMIGRLAKFRDFK